MKMFSDCSGPCETCKTHYTGGCLAGHGDDEYIHATQEWIDEYTPIVLRARPLREWNPLDHGYEEVSEGVYVGFTEDNLARVTLRRCLDGWESTVDMLVGVRLLDLDFWEECNGEEEA